MESCAVDVGFLQACIEARGPHDLNELPCKFTNGIQPTISYEKTRSNHIHATRYDIWGAQKRIALWCTHISAERKGFCPGRNVWKKRSGLIDLYPLKVVQHLHFLCIYPILGIRSTPHILIIVESYKWTGQTSNPKRSHAVRKIPKFSNWLHCGSRTKAGSIPH